MPRLWTGETGFIIAGGPSVKRQNLELLRGEHVVVINRSFETFPSADFLYFHDWRFWGQYYGRLKVFKNTIVTTSRTLKNTITDPRLRCLEKIMPPPGVSDNPMKLCVLHTSLTGAMGLLAHLGCARIVLLGADMQRGEAGETHHHPSHPWAPVDGCWDLMMEELRLVADGMKQRGIEIINTSDRSRIDWWPYMRLEDCLESALGT